MKIIVKNNIFKFDSKQDKFISESENNILQNQEEKKNTEIEEVKESFSKNLQFQYGPEEEEEEQISPIKIRKRSDVKYNFYQEDQSFSKKKNFINLNKTNPNHNKQNLNSITNRKQRNSVSLNQVTIQNLNNGLMKNICEQNEDNNEEMPSPLSPKQSYENKNDNDTDTDTDSDSNCEDNFQEQQQSYQSFRLLSNENKKTFLIEKGSFEEFQNELDDPAPQKPLQSDKIKINNMKQQKQF